MAQQETFVPADLDWFSAAARGGGLVFLAGHVAAAPDGTGGDAPFAEQVTRTLDNLERTLANAGLTFASVLKLNVFLSDMGDFAAFNEIYCARYAEPRPARTTVQARLGATFLIEIDGVARDDR